MTDPQPASPDQEPDGADAAFLRPDMEDRIRKWLMRSIAEDCTPRHLTVRAHAGPWKAFRPGVERRILREHAGTMWYLLRLAPGALLPAHRHAIDEECMVLSGSLRMGGALELREGDFHMAAKDVPHADITSDHGAVIFLRGATPVPQSVL